MNSLSPKRIHVFLLIAHGRVWLLMYLHQQTPCSGGAETWPVIQTMAECEWRVDQLWLEADLTLVSALWSAKRNCQQSSQMFPIGNFNFRTSNKIMRNSVCRMVKKINEVFLLIYLHVKYFLSKASSCMSWVLSPENPLCPLWNHVWSSVRYIQTPDIVVLYCSLFIISNSMKLLIISQTKSWRAPYLKPN